MIKGYLYVLAAAILWGTLPLACRFVYSFGCDSLTAAAARAYFAALIFAVLFLVKGTFRQIKIKDIPFYIIYGITGVGGTFLFYMLAVERLSTAMASILLYTAPAFVILFSRIFYKEKITRTKLLALLGTTLGSALVLRVYDPSFFTGNILNIFIGLLSGISYSLVTVLGKLAKKKASPEINSGLMIIFGSLIFLFIKPPTSIIVPHIPTLAGYIYLAAFGSVLPYILYLKGLSFGIDGGYASVTASVEPVVATLLCAAVFREGIEALQLIGIIAVFVSIVFAVKR